MLSNDSASTGNGPHNPWLSIPAVDYEAHMGSAGTKQLGLLADLFERTIKSFHPKSLMVLGCATGNGFDRIDPGRLDRLVALDINPEYTDIVRQRHAATIPNLEIVNKDVCECEFTEHSFDLIWCGLFFEHVDPTVVLPKIKKWLIPSGLLATVIQLPAESGVVSSTGVESIKLLAKSTRLVESEALGTITKDLGFSQLESDSVSIEGGKSFKFLVYRRDLQMNR